MAASSYGYGFDDRERQAIGHAVPSNESRHEHNEPQAYNSGEPSSVLEARGSIEYDNELLATKDDLRHSPPPELPPDINKLSKSDLEDLLHTQRLCVAKDYSRARQLREQAAELAEQSKKCNQRATLLDKRQSDRLSVARQLQHSIEQCERRHPTKKRKRASKQNNTVNDSRLTNAPLTKAKRFQCRGKAPEDYYALMADQLVPFYDFGFPLRQQRMIRMCAPFNEILVFAGWSCLGGSDVDKNYWGRAACAIIHKPVGESLSNEFRSFEFRLEHTGPDGAPFEQSLDSGANGVTAARAAPRAAVAALECVDWAAEGWKKVVVALNSRYVVDGITESTAKEAFAQDKNLWDRLLALVNEHARSGCEIFFWDLAGDDEETDEMAKKKALSEAQCPEAYLNVRDVLPQGHVS